LPVSWRDSGTPEYRFDSVAFGANDSISSKLRILEEDEVFLAFSVDDSAYFPGTEDKILVFKEVDGTEIASVCMTSSNTIVGHYGNVSAGTARPDKITNNYYWFQCKGESPSGGDGILRVWHNIIGHFGSSTLLIEITNGG
jgi:hypothetical protein